VRGTVFLASPERQISMDHPKEPTERALSDTTAAEVIEKLPEASVITCIDAGRPGDVHVVLPGFDSEEASALVLERGFTLA
jgi:hypothetical protein